MGAGLRSPGTGPVCPSSGAGRQPAVQRIPPAGEPCRAGRRPGRQSLTASRRPHHTRPSAGVTRGQSHPLSVPSPDLDRPMDSPTHPRPALIYDSRQNVKYTHGIGHCNYRVINSAARLPRAGKNDTVIGGGGGGGGASRAGQYPSPSPVNSPPQ